MWLARQNESLLEKYADVVKACTMFMVDGTAVQTCHLVRIVHIQYGFWPVLR